MRALVVDGSGGISLQQVPTPRVSTECLIRVTRAGICGTDLHLLTGYAEFTGVPGHEFVGVVEDAPAADAGWIGKRVVGEINAGWGACAWCVRGIKEHCETRTVVGIRGRGGAFADYLTLPAVNLHEVPAPLDDDGAVFVEPVAAACRIGEQVDLGPASQIAVVGDGRLGILVAQVLRLRSPQLTVFGRHPEKLAVARAVGIAARTFSPEDAQRFDVVVDATGRREGFARAIELVRPRGTIVLKSTFHGEAHTALWPIAVHEVTIVGSRCGPFARAIEMLASAQVQTAPLVCAHFPLEDYEQAVTAARHGLKVILDLANGTTLPLAKIR